MRNIEVIRAATIENVDLLVNHHIAMFREIINFKAKKINEESYHRMAITYKKKLYEQLPVGICKAWIAFKDQKSRQPVASAALSITNAVPTPMDNSYRISYIHSVYTEKEWRKHGYATLLVKIAIKTATENEINRIHLAASSVGRKLYDKLGFQEIKSMMQLLINRNS
jgi:predicted GNAT family acetyltransferase